MGSEMNPLVRRLKNSFAHATQQFRQNFNEFRSEVELDDFLIDKGDFSGTAEELAATALFSLCRRDGLVWDMIVCVAVVHFLDFTLDPPASDPDAIQRTKDLHKIVRNPGVLSEYVRWAKSWYG